jgi:site-specific DNA recombinase
MVEQRPIRRAIHLEFAFDRLLAAKLEQAYDILVPGRVRVVGSAKVTGAGDEDGSNLRSCIVGQTMNTIASQTAALVAFARAQQFEVPKEWVFEDDGYSGANLIRPGLSGCAILLPRD